VVDNEDIIKEVEKAFFETVNVGTKIDDASPLDVELPEGADVSA